VLDAALLRFDPALQVIRPSRFDREFDMNEEAQARSAFVLSSSEGRVLVPGGVVLKASGRQTGGAFEVLELHGPSGPPPHVHLHRDELFYIVQGSFEFTLGDETVQAAVGSLVFVPRGTRHAFNAGPDSKGLVFVVPGGLEGFFTELAVGMAAGKSQAEIREALEAKYDSHPA
jgi:quercetin dioxygenase-like cupin family protein